jgi:hypothetical protein
MPSLERVREDCFRPLFHYEVSNRARGRLQQLVQPLVLDSRHNLGLFGTGKRRSRPKLREAFGRIPLSMGNSDGPRETPAGCAVRADQNSGVCDPLKENAASDGLVIGMGYQDKRGCQEFPERLPHGAAPCGD